jgi:triacylglycerol lipase
MPERKKSLPRITLENLRPPYDEFEGEDAGGSAHVYFADADGLPAAERNPFRPDSREFELVNAWWLCEAATLAYSDPARVERIFKSKTPLREFRAFATGGGTDCFVASNDDFALVVFRGTEAAAREGRRRDFRDIFRDIHTDVDIRTSVFGEDAKAHRGFADAVEEVLGNGGLREHVSNLPSRKIWFTGHSLGAALATLAAARSERLDGLYTFGSPRVGDAGFASAFGRQMADRGIEYQRFVNGDDVVTTVPLASSPPVVLFKHAGTLRHIDREGRVSEDPSRFEELKEKVRDLLPFGVGGRLDPRFFNHIPNALDDHVPTLYAAHIWNAYVEEQGG